MSRLYEKEFNISGNGKNGRKFQAVLHLSPFFETNLTAVCSRVLPSLIKRAPQATGRELCAEEAKHLVSFMQWWWFIRESLRITVRNGDEKPQLSGAAAFSLRGKELSSSRRLRLNQQESERNLSFLFFHHQTAWLQATIWDQTFRYHCL